MSEQVPNSIKEIKTEIKTVLVCYTQATFDNLAVDDESAGSDGDVEADENEPLAIARRIEQTAHKLTAALKIAGLTAEEIKVPQRSFAPRDVAKAAFGWRLLDVSESNGVKIDLVICLDFPAWTIAHPNKICWLTYLPYFIMRRRSGPRPTLNIPAGALLGSVTPANLVGPSKSQEDVSQTISSLLQGERRGLAEAKRVLTGSREIAQEVARSGLLTEYNPFPANPEADVAGPEWQAAIKRLLAGSGNA